MGYQVVPICDGCGKKIEAAEVLKSNAESVAYVIETKPENASLMQEIFCAVCVECAKEFWTEKLKMLSEAVSKIERFKRAFFQERKFKAKQQAEARIQ